MEMPTEKVPCFAGRLGPGGDEVFISAPAKINLFLKVLGKRPDGYHDLYSWFQALDLADHLEIRTMPDPQIDIHTDSREIPTGEDNLVYRAARLIQAHCPEPTGFRIKLWKRIPVGAGLGGGSADAAAFIMAANRLLGLGLSRSQMAGLGLSLGSDLPFFFSRGQAEVTGRGERVRPIKLPVDYQVILVTPPFQIRSAEAYSRLRLDLTEAFAGISLMNWRQVRDFFRTISKLANDLEQALRESYPVLGKIGDFLAATGAVLVRMSGSGPTVFALYENDVLVEDRLRQSIEGEGWGMAHARPVILPA